MADALNSRKRSNSPADRLSEGIGKSGARRAADPGDDVGIQRQLVTTLDEWPELFESGAPRERSPLGARPLDSGASPAQMSCPQPADHFRVLDRCRAILAAADCARGRVQEAEQSYRQALARTEKLRGSGHPDVARALIGLADLYSRQGRHQEAGALLERAHLVRREALPSNHPEVALSYSALAENRVCLGKYGEALSAYVVSIQMLESVFGAAHYSVAKVKSNLACLYVTLGRFQEAEHLYREVLALRAGVEAWSRPVTCEIVTILGELACALGWYGEAEHLAGEALALTAGERPAGDELGSQPLESAPAGDSRSSWAAAGADCQLAIDSEERRLLRLTAEGLSPHDISVLLAVRPETVKIALVALLRKLSALPASVARQNLQSLITT